MKGRETHRLKTAFFIELKQRKKTREIKEEKEKR